MRGGGKGPFNLTRLSLGSRQPFLILGVALVNGGGVDIFVVVRLQAKQALVLGELIPGAASAGFLQRPINFVTRIGDPGL